ncbi:MAG: outer membrane protein assembly factor BamE [Candidatus Tectomicrobia bacterium]|nr:outer membrane protein assembly factor BamE [Candidatus Tectomicrobia bacterium]
MRKFLTIATAIGLVYVLTGGCAFTTGQKIEPSNLSAIQVGKTTRQQVLSTFGKPDRTETYDRSEVLIYFYSESTWKQEGKNRIMQGIKIFSTDPPQVKTLTQALRIVLKDGIVTNSSYSSQY